MQRSAGVQGMTALAYPADLSNGVAEHQAVGGDIAHDDCAERDQGV
ncbi:MULTISPECIES: hypothetical protein [unclassified Streptomyces]